MRKENYQKEGILKMKIKRDHVSNSVANQRTYGKGSSKKKSVVIHQTGNPNKGANAEMHSRLQKNLNPRQASWHETVDDKEAIINFDPGWQCWHASDGRGAGNLHGYSIELTINSDANYRKTIENGAKRAAYWLKKFNLTVSNGLKQHADFASKNCPQQLRAGKDGISWSDFKKMVEDEMKGKPAKAPIQKKQTKKSNDVVAKEVYDGKWGNNPERKQKLENAGYNYNTIQGLVNKLAGQTKATPKPKLKSVNTVVEEVKNGLWGNNPERKQRLEKAGYNYKVIQDLVNKQAGTSKSKTNSQLADEVWQGKWGQGEDRKNRLTKAGYNYNAVQKEVNRKYG